MGDFFGSSSVAEGHLEFAGEAGHGIRWNGRPHSDGLDNVDAAIVLRREAVKQTDCVRFVRGIWHTGGAGWSTDEHAISGASKDIAASLMHDVGDRHDA